MESKLEPVYIIFAGINGAGKTTLYKSKLWQCEFPSTPLMFINPDEIIKENGLCSSNESDQIIAGRKAVLMINDCLKSGKSFCHETVFAAKSTLPRIRRAKKLGFRVLLFYVGVRSCEVAIERISKRVSLGGHAIDTSLVKARWNKTLENLKAALKICDEVHVFDNTNMLSEVVTFCNGKLFWKCKNEFNDGWFLDLLEHN